MIKSYKFLKKQRIFLNVSKEYLDCNKDDIVRIDEESAKYFLDDTLELTDNWRNIITDNIENESQISTTNKTVTVNNVISTVKGVWLASDVGHIGTNYYRGNGFIGKEITLYKPLNTATTPVIVSYESIGDTITTVDSYQTYVKYFELCASYNKSLNVVIQTPDIIPSGSILKIESIDESGSIIETRERIFDTISNTSISLYISGFSFNISKKYKVTLTLPQAITTDYTATCTLDEINIDVAVGASIKNNGIINGLNNISINLYDSNNDIILTPTQVNMSISLNDFYKVADDTLISNVSSNGSIITNQDNVSYILQSDGNIELDITPISAGTPSYNELTITEFPLNADTFTIGLEIYEFNDDITNVGNGHIFIDILGLTTIEEVVTASKNTIYNNTNYELLINDNVNVLEVTASKYFEIYNTLITQDNNSRMNWADNNFGGGIGASVIGIDPTTTYYLLIQSMNGENIFMSDELPYSKV